MKKLICTMIVSSLVSIAAQALAADAPNLHDRAAMTQLSVIEARKSLLALCGVTGDAADKGLAKDKEKAAKLQAGLSDEGKKALSDAMAKIDDGIKASWDKTPEADRAKSCDALKAQMAAGK